MPQLSISDCETLLRLLEDQAQQNSDSQDALAHLRQLLEQTTANDASADLVSEPIRNSDMLDAALGACTLHVCTSCRPAGTPREPQESRPGFQLYQELQAMLSESPLGQQVQVKPAPCLSLCSRPCGIAFSSPGAWNYLFGDQQPGETARDILTCVSTYISTRDGLLMREQRPEPLRASILGRVPPFEDPE